MTEGPSISGLQAENAWLRQELDRLKSMDAQLQDYQRKIRAVYDQTFQFIGLLTPDGTMIEVNQTALRFAGIQSDQVIGKPFDETPWWTHSREEQERLRDAIRRAGQGEFIRFETTHRGADGELHAVDFSLKPVMDETGSVVYLIPEGRDITESRQITEQLESLNAQLEDSTRKYKAVFDQAFQFIGLLSLEGTLIEVNQAALHFIGVRAEDVVGKPFWETPWWTHSAMEQERLMDAIREARAGRTARFETTHCSADGVLHPYDFSLKPVLDENGTPIYLIPEGLDITERRRASDILQRAKEELEQRVAARTAELASANRELNQQFEALSTAQSFLKRLTEILESTSDLVALAAPDLRLTYLNAAGREMLGIPADSELDAFRIEHPLWAFKLIREEGIPTAIREGRWSGETALTGAGGREIDVSQVIMAHRSPAGELEYLSTIMRDISERKRTTRFLDAILNAVGDPIFVKDRDHRWLVLNRALCDFLGYSKEQLLGKSDYDFFPKEQADVFWKADEDVFRTQEENLNQEEITDAAGIPHVISTRKGVFGDGSGNQFLVGVIRDITDLKVAERRLRTNLRYLNSIIENLPLCVKLVDADGTILDMNPSGLAMIGAPPGLDVSGTHIDTLLVEEDKEAFHRFNAEVCAGASRSLRFHIRDLNGIVHTMESVSVPIPNADRDGYIHLGLARDLTDDLKREQENRALEKQLQQTHKMEAIGTLAGGIAHDFNNILTAILGYAELVHQDMEDPQMRRDLEQVVAAALRAKDLIKQILTFSRMRQEELRPQRLQPVLHEAIRLIRASIPANIEIVERVDPECGPVLADAGQIHQIVMNLCTNAYFAMREKGGLLRVSMRRTDLGPGGMPPSLGLSPGRYVVIEVEDTGVGMTADVVERIFEPYFTTRGKDEGTGLGLSVVHGIVQGHGGIIQVRSTPGSGSLFTIHLPQAETFSIANETASEPIAGGHERILVVDDEEVLATMMAKNLSRLGYNVASFTSSEAVLSAFQADPDGFDLVITDMSMPRLTGVQLARELLRIRPALRIIICTGYSEALTLQTAKAAGIRDVLMKPLLLADLAKAIRRLFD